MRDEELTQEEFDAAFAAGIDVEVEGAGRVRQAGAVEPGAVPAETTGRSNLRAVTAAMIEQGWSLVRVEGNEAQSPGLVVHDVGSAVIRR